MEKEKSNPNGSQPTDKKKFPVKKVVIISVIAVLAVGLFFVARYAYFALNPSAAFDVAAQQQAESPSASPSASADAAVATAPVPTTSVDSDEAMLSQADLDFIKDKVNILMIGVDENPTRDQSDRKDYRSDVMMMLCIDFKQKTVHMLSVPRDSYAPIYNTKAKWKLNYAFTRGGGFEGQGFEYVCKSVSNLLGGIPITYYAGVQMYGLRDLIDAVGGVDYNVDVPVRLEGRVVNPGMQHLTGQQVLDYCRVRKGISTDIGREQRQQALLFTLFKQLQKEKKLTLIPKVFEAMKDQIHTNLSTEQLIALVSFAMNIDPDSITRHTLDGTYMPAYNCSKYYVLHMADVRKTVHDIFGINIKTDNRYDIGYVSADMACSSAISSAQSFLSSYKSKMSASQKSSVESAISRVKSLRSSSMSSAKAAAAKLKSLCYSIEKDIKSSPSPSSSSSSSKKPSASASASDSTASASASK